jgi:hypothetical protein
MIITVKQRMVNSCTCFRNGDKLLYGYFATVVYFTKLYPVMLPKNIRRKSPGDNGISNSMIVTPKSAHTAIDT